MSIHGLFNTEMTINAVTVTRDSGGGQVEAVTPRALVRCRVRQLTGSERELLGREGVVTSHRVYFEANTDLTERDSVVIGSDAFDVLRVDNPHGMDRYGYADMVLRV